MTQLNRSAEFATSARRAHPVKALVTSPLPTPLVDRFRALLPLEIQLDIVPSTSTEDFAIAGADAEVLIVPGNLRRIDAGLLSLAPKVRFVQQIGIGYDTLDVHALHQAGIVAAYTPSASAVSTAEHTLLLMLALIKRFVHAESAARQGGWPSLELMQAGIGDLAGARVGLVGLGHVGGAVAQRLRGFDACVSYTARYPVDSETERRLHVTFVSMNELLSDSEIVSLHLPLTNQTRGLLGDAELARMRQGAFLVNTSRGGIIQETALRLALETGHLRGAALDVVENETAGGNQFSDFPQVIVTPHIGGASRAATATALQMGAENLIRYVHGEPVQGRIPAPVSD